jgi:hypothetical protein
MLEKHIKTHIESQDKALE